MSAGRGPLLPPSPRLIAPLLLLALLLPAAPARGAGESAAKVEQAKVLFQVGAQAFGVGQYDAAIQAFEEAAKLAPRPGMFFSLAQAQRRQYPIDRDRLTLEGAMANFRRYLAQVEKGGRRAEAAEALAELELLAARLPPAEGGAGSPAAAAGRRTRLMVSSPAPGAEIWLDGEPMSAAPLITELQAGKHRVKVSAAGFFDEEREIAAAEGGIIALDLVLREKPGRLAVVAPAGAGITVDGRWLGRAPLATFELAAGSHDLVVASNGHELFQQRIDLARGKLVRLDARLETSRQRIVSWLLLGSAAACLAAGGAAAGLAYREQSAAQQIWERKEQRGIGPEELGRYEEAAELRDGYRLGAGIGLGAGVVVGTIGVLAWLFDEPTVPRAGEPRPPATPAEAPRQPPSRPASSPELGVAPPWPPRSLPAGGGPGPGPGLGLVLGGHF
ncbi:MAG: PEGA domain-containing protein [Deltaproteobacteria bacterium]|nr:PEGA domain-containing protein [Deltaproteobacteria bacterium]